MLVYLDALVSFIILAVIVGGVVLNWLWCCQWNDHNSEIKGAHWNFWVFTKRKSWKQNYLVNLECFELLSLHSQTTPNSTHFSVVLHRSHYWSKQNRGMGPHDYMPMGGGYGPRGCANGIGNSNWSLLLFLSSQMGIPGKTVGTMFIPVPLEVVCHEPERVGGTYLLYL